MTETRDPIDAKLLDRFQRGFPVAPAPFALIGRKLGVGEAEVLKRLRALNEAGAVGRVGGVARPGAFGASTLAAIAAPEGRDDIAAAAVCEASGVNHAYLREADLNLWFVATGPDRAHLDAAIAGIEARTGRKVVDLPLVRPYHIDLGFRLDGPTLKRKPRTFDADAIEPGDGALAQALCDGLALTSRPYLALARTLRRSEAEVIRRIDALLEAGAITRLGVIVRHRALGWRANAMVCFQPPEDRIDAFGEVLAEQNGVTLCYRRRASEAWPYPLFCMVHGKTREGALSQLATAIKRAGMRDVPHRVLFSTECLLQRGAMVRARAPQEVAA